MRRRLLTWTFMRVYFSAPKVKIGFSKNICAKRRFSSKIILLQKKLFFKKSFK